MSPMDKDSFFVNWFSVSAVFILHLTGKAFTLHIVITYLYNSIILKLLDRMKKTKRGSKNLEKYNCKQSVIRNFNIWRKLTTYFQQTNSRSNYHIWGIKITVQLYALPTKTSMTNEPNIYIYISVVKNANKKEKGGKL